MKHFGPEIAPIEYKKEINNTYNNKPRSTPIEE